MLYPIFTNHLENMYTLKKIINNCDLYGINSRASTTKGH